MSKKKHAGKAKAPKTAPKKQSWQQRLFALEAHRLGMLIFAAALLTRLIHLVFIMDLPTAEQPIGDGESYHLWAQEIAAGNWVGDEVFFVAPLYPYVLGAFYTIFGTKLVLFRCFQIILGSLACVFLFRAGSNFFDKRTGAVAGFLFAFYPVAIHFDTLIQKTSLAFFLFAAFLYLVSRLMQEQRPPLWLGAGAILGLLAITRENAIIFLPILLLWLFLEKEIPVNSKLLQGGAFALGLALIILPLTIRNKVVADQWVITTSNMGTNFYIGNRTGATGSYEPLRPGRDNWKFEREDAIALARQESGEQLEPAEVSSFWLKKALGEISGSPGSWLKLMVKKTMLVANSAEVGDTEDIYTYTQHSPLLQILTLMFHFGILFPLAMGGIWLYRKEWKQHLPLLLMLAGYAASVIGFFVFDRFRFPISGILVLFAAAALLRIGEFMPSKQGGAWPLAIVLGALVFANWPVVNRAAFKATTELNLGKMYAQEGKHKEALPHLQAAMDADPNRVDVHISLGNTLLNLGQFSKARKHLLSAHKLNPEHGEALSQLGLLSILEGKDKEARDYYEKALPLLPEDPGCRNNLAWVLATSSDRSLHDGERAVALALEADRMVPNHRGYLDTLGTAYARTGDFAKAIEVTEQALALSKEAGASSEIEEKSERLNHYRASKAWQQ